VGLVSCACNVFAGDKLRATAIILFLYRYIVLTPSRFRCQDRGRGGEVIENDHTLIVSVRYGVVLYIVTHATLRLYRW
jgi:hypothetical protein